MDEDRGMGEQSVADELTVVTVTYGDRGEHVRRTIDSVLLHPGVRVVVVSNGSAPDTRTVLEAYDRTHPGRVRRLDFAENRGSAPAFANALQVAYEFGDPILLLDDDNPIDLPTLDSLLTLAGEVEGDSDEAFALVVHRPVNSAQRAIISGLRVAEVFRELNPGAFHGFDLFARHRPPHDSGLADERHRWQVAAKTFITHRVPVTMWGGLFLSRRAIQLKALPNADLILYGDDNDFSRAFREAGGTIHLIEGLEIIDSEAWRPSTPQRRTWRSRFPSTFRTAPDASWRLQYLFRNQAYLSARQASADPGAKARLALNAFVRMSGVIVLGLLAGRPRLTWQLTAASLSGLRGRLGASYPLPQ